LEPNHQFGAFCPLFRLHGDRAPETINECGRTGAPDEVWHYGDAAYTSIQAIMQLRESIRPYVSAIMKEANQTGTPALRPLFLEFPDDPMLWSLGDKIDGTLMFGPDYLISPVTTFNASSWEVYLPVLPSTGARWVHHYTSKAYTGGQSVQIDVSNLDTFPLFKRSDARYATV
jgi:alpha-D-xyloside xylohydrolase